MWFESLEVSIHDSNDYLAQDIATKWFHTFLYSDGSSTDQVGFDVSNMSKIRIDRSCTFSDNLS